MGLQYMTKIQAQSIPEALKGQDVLGAARTGDHCVALSSDVMRDGLAVEVLARHWPS